jgi:Domain of unknown function (DUF4249)
MKNKHIIIGVLCSCIYFLRCTPQDDISIEVNNPKLVLNAVLSANEVPSLYVGRTFSPTDKVPNDHFINNANVTLYENNIFIGQLIHQQNGVYQLPSLTLKVGKSYLFKVKANGYAEASNIPVLIPKNVESNSVLFDNKTVYPSTGYSSVGNGDHNKARLLSVKLPETINESYYGLSVKRTSEGSDINGNIYPIEVGTTALYKLNTDCYKYVAFIINSDFNLIQQPQQAMILYNASCFGKEKKMGLVLETYGTVQKQDTDGWYHDATIDRLEATIVTLSEEYFTYSKKNKIIEGIDNAFFEPQRVYTNVVNGYGVVVAINKKVVVFNL